jgi:hypothetical protein
VRGTQFIKAMKNMDVGDIWPREVVEVEDGNDQVVTSPNEQVNAN